jgi:hypothetical protein
VGRIAPVLALLALAACGREDGATLDPGGSVGPPPPPLQQVSPQQPASPASYVGRWAARPELCAGGAWVFEEQRVTTAGEVSCDFTKVAPMASGYQVEARCVAQGPPADSTFMLTLTDPAPPQTMTVNGGPWDAGVTLVRCPG